MTKAILALADGTIFEGTSVGASGEASGEVVFNTSLTGYQEILTDPSYVGQMICMTYPEQGNYGVASADDESDRIHGTGFIVRHFAEQPSSFRADRSLDAYLKANGVVGISGIDTRRLTRHLRTYGSQMGVISSTGTAAGSPGPLVRNTPSGLSARVSAAVVRLGTTVMRQPWSASRRSMARFSPQS